MNSTSLLPPTLMSSFFQGINYYERILLENKTKAILNDAEMTKSFLVLGHLHLLIGDFGKGNIFYHTHLTHPYYSIF